MQALSWMDWAVVALYLAAMIAMGAWFGRRERDTEQYFLAGRKLPWWVAGISIFGTSLSAITFLSIPGTAYAENWLMLPANLGILYIAPLVAYAYVPRLRASEPTTAYGYLEERFGGWVRGYGALCFVTFQMGRVGIVMLLPAIALETTTGIDLYTCVLVMGVLATLYTTLGGIEAVVWTDVVQSVVLTGSALLAFGMAAWQIDGGVVGAFSAAYAADKLHVVDWRMGLAETTVVVIVVGHAFSAFYPSTSDQTVVQRYLTTASDRDAQRAVWTNALLAIPASLLFFSLGTMLWSFYAQSGNAIPEDLRNDAILPWFVIHQFPLGLRGLVIAGLFAAAMSSLDSSLNSIASVVVNDGIRRWRPDTSDSRCLALGRVATVIFGAIGTGAALLAATFQTVTLWQLSLLVLNFFGGGLAGVFALGVFTTRTTQPAALIGAFFSALVMVALQFPDASGELPIHPFIHAFFGFWAAVVFGYAASWVIEIHRKGFRG